MAHVWARTCEQLQCHSAQLSRVRQAFVHKCRTLFYRTFGCAMGCVWSRAEGIGLFLRLFTYVHTGIWPANHWKGDHCIKAHMIKTLFKRQVLHVSFLVNFFKIRLFVFTMYCHGAAKESTSFRTQSLALPLIKSKSIWPHYTFCASQPAEINILCS